MPFQDMPRYFVPPTYPRGAGGILPPAWGRPTSILAPSEFTLSQNPDVPGPVVPDPWHGRLARTGMPTQLFDRGTDSAGDIAARQTQKQLEKVKLQQAWDQIAAFKAERPFQQLLQRYKLQSMADAMEAARQANESYGKFSLGAGLGLGFQRPTMDIASDQGRHARGFELLKNALEDAAPPVTVHKILHATPTVTDFVEKLLSGGTGDIHPNRMSMAALENYNAAKPIALAMQQRKGFGGF